MLPFAAARIEPHIRRLIASYHHWIGEPLIRLDETSASSEKIVRSLCGAEFAIVSHGTGPDPIFNFGNRTALALFEMDWTRFTRLPSRLSADPDARGDRARLMERVARDGFVTGYRGIRVSATGKRFVIANATIWEVMDSAGNNYGRAAKFDRWWPAP